MTTIRMIKRIRRRMERGESKDERKEKARTRISMRRKRCKITIIRKIKGMRKRRRMGRSESKDERKERGRTAISKRRERSKIAMVIKDNETEEEDEEGNCKNMGWYDDYEREGRRRR